MSYVSLRSVKDLNTHHHLYHKLVTYQCPTCKKTLATPTAFKWHQYMHLPLTYKCDRCNNTYVYKSKLQQHSRVHHKYKKYNCCFGRCQKSYRHPQDLERHISTHSGLSFECALCNKTFWQKKLLRRHEVVHTDVTRYTCKLCNKGFKHQNQLYRHKKSCTI